MRKLIGLIGVAVICTMFIASANANNNGLVPVEMSHVEAAALINKEMDNWTNRDLGLWLVEHSYKYTGGHGFTTMMFSPTFIFRVAKSPTVTNENGFSCSQVIASVYLPGDMKKQTNGIAVKICVKGDNVLVDIAATLTRGESLKLP